jgi:hypothetical protein
MKEKLRHYKNLRKHERVRQPSEPWFVKYWRPAAGWIYLGICLFDFVIMPLLTSHTNLTISQILEISITLRPEDKLNAIVQLSRKISWEPLTLMGNGMFHMAFGALLSVAAWSRGKVQESQINNGIFPAMEEAMVMKTTTPTMGGMGLLPQSGGMAGMPMNTGMGGFNNGMPMNTGMNTGFNNGMPMNTGMGGFNNGMPLNTGGGNGIPSNNMPNNMPSPMPHPVASTPTTSAPLQGTQHNVDAPP